tara:strand:- start:4745 stop:5260 length:516 start_codon:yes stop_codon:yes gene_type:complete
MFNVGGAAGTIDIGLKNDSGATRVPGDIVATKIANLSATLGSGLATGYEADLVLVGSGGSAGQGDFNRVATGVVVGKSGHSYAVGDEMMVRIFGPATAKVTIAGGASTAAYQDLVMSNGAVALSPVAKVNYATAPAEAAQLQRAVALEVVANAGAAPADFMCNVLLKWPSI